MVIELNKDKKSNKQIYIRSPNSKEAQQYDPLAWVAVATPKGSTTESFDNAIIGGALAQQKAYEQSEHPYTSGGANNSNRFVYDIVTAAGGRVPGAASAGFWYGAPGLCGGSAHHEGDDCSH